MASDFPKLTQAIEDGMAAGLHLGAMVHVRRDGAAVADFAIGRAGLWPSAPLRTDQRLLWLSAGKPLTAMAIAILSDRGRLQFDDLVAQYIPEFAKNGKDQISIRHVLMQAHGFKPPRLDWPRWPREQVIEAICEASLVRGAVPGEFAAYDPQAGWYVLSEIVQRVTGTPNHEFVQREILQPLGSDVASIGMAADEWQQMVDDGQVVVMHDTSYSSREGTDLREEALPGEGDAPVPRQPHPWAGDDAQRAEARNPGGGTIARAVDMALVYECLLLGGKTPGGESLIRGETVEEMTRRQRVGLKDHTFGQVVDWGLGFLINSAHYGALANPYGYGKHASKDTFGHGGMQSSGGFADPENGLCGAIIFNGLPGEPKHQRRIDLVMTALYVDLGLN